MQLLPVTKTVGPDVLAAALAAGMDAFGESRVQEAEAKAEAVDGATWHLVGRLQANKAARAVAVFESIHALDSLELGQRLDRLVRESDRPQPLAVYLQVNVDDDPAKAGFTVDGVERALPVLARLNGLELRGLMTVGRLGSSAEDARPTFARLAALAGGLCAAEPALGSGLSMGMSDDFEVAVEEGSTVVRIGRLVFGARPPA